ncbi:phage baseplate protein [Streptomyces albogriseolus]|uniref:phage baseplate protein n=1 Tax=Streptomyces albogriseolus TaxID=1887 RepID=UPI00345F5DC2
MPSGRFDLTAPTVQIFPAPVLLDQSRVHQQVDYDEENGLLYVTQVIANGQTLADETEPPPTGTRDSRGDLAINQVTLDGLVTGVMYVRAFDHGSGIGVEVEDGTTYLWLAYDAEMQPIGTNAHGRRLVRLPFVTGSIVDVGDPGLDVYTPIEGATAITPGLDLAHGHMAIAYSTGSGTTYEVHDLARFKAKDYSAPLYRFPRPSYPQFQSWCLYGDYVYQQHGTPYDDTTNPPDGGGNAYFTVIDIRTGDVVQRVKNLNQPALTYREPEALAVWNLPAGPRLVYGWAVSDDPPRRMDLYGIDRMVGDVDADVSLAATVINDPQPPVVQLDVTVPEPSRVLSWQIDRIVSGIAQNLTGGDAATLPTVYVDTSPVGCRPVVYRLTVFWQDGGTAAADSPTVTVIPDEGCPGSGGSVGEEPNTLGCPDSYTAVIHWRGGAQPFSSASMDRLTKVTWSRTANDISDAAVTLLKGDIPTECCAALADCEPWVHELTLYRDSDLVWQGPIIRVIERGESFLIEALDVFAWLDRLVNTWLVQYTTVSADSAGRKRAPVQYIAWNHIRLNMAESPLSVPDDYAGILPYIQRRGETLTLPTSFIKAGSGKKAIWPAFVGDILRELTKRGLVWTTVGRAILLSSTRTWFGLARPGVRLTEADFAGDLEVVKDGMGAATYAFATTKQENDLTPGKTFGTGKTGTPYGRLDLLVDMEGTDPDDPVTDRDIRETAAAALLGKYPVPVTINVPQGSALNGTAPVTIEQLVPGERFDVFTQSYCTQVQAGFLLSDLEVEWDGVKEKVAVSLIPAGDAVEEWQQ